MNCRYLISKKKSENIIKTIYNISDEVKNKTDKFETEKLPELYLKYQILIKNGLDKKFTFYKVMKKLYS